MHNVCVFAVLQTFIANAASQTGDANSSRHLVSGPVSTFVIVYFPTLLVVPQWLSVYQSFLQLCDNEEVHFVYNLSPRAFPYRKNILGLFRLAGTFKVAYTSGQIFEKIMKRYPIFSL